MIFMFDALDTDERTFFELVSRATFSNPFSVRRQEVDLALAEVTGHVPDVVERVLVRLRGRLDGLDRQGRLRLGPDQTGQLLEFAVLFDVFHRYAEPFKAHLAAQFKAGAEAIRVDFADDLLKTMCGRGVAPRRAEQLLGLFFQMHRAFHFIGDALVGRSPSMRGLRESLWDNVFTSDLRRYDRHLMGHMEDFSTILLGETGTGKGAAASAIGRSGYIPFVVKSWRFARSFVDGLVPLNLSQFPEGLLESELFGHHKGAFTGAVASHEGLLARCGPHGAIFLDEIGEASIPVQIKLLTVLQDRTFTPVGSHQPQRFEGRVIAATHRSLDQLRREGRFRDDFYYRLCSDVIEVPPLRRRVAEDPAELTDLLEVIVTRILGTQAPEVVAEVAQGFARDLPADYSWPGNVRELEQFTRRFLLKRRVSPNAVTTDIVDDPARLASAIRNGHLDAKTLLSIYCSQLYERHGTFEHVARVTGLDRRTVKKHVERQRGGPDGEP